jgi:ring-1,2-phenylacetyl-CoA epoxidase subunit PaaD
VSGLAVDLAAAVRRAAAEVVDPELPMLTLAELGVLRSVEVEDGVARVAITPTYSGCPAIAEMRADLVARLRDAGCTDVQVRIELSPPWSSDDITPAGRAALAAHGVAPPGPVPHRGAVPMAFGVRSPSRPCPHCGSDATDVLSSFGSTPCTSVCRCRACAETFPMMKAI